MMLYSRVTVTTVATVTTVTAKVLLLAVEVVLEVALALAVTSPPDVSPLRIVSRLLPLASCLLPLVLPTIAVFVCL